MRATQTKGTKKMNHRLKALGLALVAVFAMSAIASSAASATVATFTSGSNWTKLSGSSIGEQVFTAKAGEEVKCKSVSVDDATMGTDQSEITVTPTYGVTIADVVTEAVATTSECVAKIPAGELPATIHNEGCHYTFIASGTDATVHITPTPTGGSCVFKITVYFLGKFRPCFEVANQTPGKRTITLTNETYVSGGANRWDVRLKSDVEEIEYTRTKGGICGEGTFKGAEGAKYSGEVTVKGTETEGKATDVTFDPAT
ncbi:MAG TPA: hypothetical protein VF085_04055 [Solirubrobacterales bacterium]